MKKRKTKWVVLNVISVIVLLLGVALMITVSKLHCPPGYLCGYQGIKTQGYVVGSILSALGIIGCIYSLVKILK